MTSIYIETTIPSLATAKPSRDTIVAGRQASTLLFWENRRHDFDLYISQYVIEEYSLGDSDAAARRIDFIKGITVIPSGENITALAYKYQRLIDIPDKSILDCFHLAVCVIAGIDYLLSWNCTHLGVSTFAKLHRYNITHGMHTPLLLTPEALMEMEG